MKIIALLQVFDQKKNGINGLLKFGNRFASSVDVNAVKNPIFFLINEDKSKRKTLKHLLH